MGLPVSAHVSPTCRNEGGLMGPPGFRCLLILQCGPQFPLLSAKDSFTQRQHRIKHAPTATSIQRGSLHRPVFVCRAYRAGIETASPSSTPNGHGAQPAWNWANGELRRGTVLTWTEVPAMPAPVCPAVDLSDVGSRKPRSLGGVMADPLSQSLCNSTRYIFMNITHIFRSDQVVRIERHQMKMINGISSSLL